jgi:cytosine/adenosine deaminase-related metal-dependent hydrolase
MAVKSSPEEEYFARESAEKLRKLAAEQQKKLATAEKEELKKRHWMRCPKCGMELKTLSYKGLEIDRCFACHGTWLDAGELEKVAGSEAGVMQSVINLFSVKKP